MDIRGIILAGGLSSRMGSNKLTKKIDGRNIIDIVIENVKNSRLSDIVVVTGKYDISTELPKRHNQRYEEGMSTSIIEGMKDYKGDGVMIVLGDMPFVSSQIINRLIEEFKEGDKGIVVPCFNGKRGNPVILGRKYFSDLLNNNGDKGAREIINSNSEDVEFIETHDEGVLRDIDDEKALTVYNKA